MLSLDEYNWKTLMRSWSYQVFMRSELDLTGIKLKAGWEEDFWAQSNERTEDICRDITVMLKYDSKGWEFYSSWVLMLLVPSCKSPFQFASENHVESCMVLVPACSSLSGCMRKLKALRVYKDMRKGHKIGLLGSRTLFNCNCMLQ